MEEKQQKEHIQLEAASSQKKSPRKKIVFLAGGILALFVLLLTAYFLISKNPAKTSDSSLTDGKQGTQNTSGKKQQPPSGTFIYGIWSGQNSIIKGYDLGSQKIAEVASLPSAIKKVSVLSPSSLIYIDQTDSRDHGKQIVVYDIKTKRTIATIPAAEGFGIDEYFLSPNKQYVATWEVSFAPNTQVLQGGKSRVYVIDLAKPATKNLLFDETASPIHPVHYPRAVLNNGTVFADSFLPNDPNGGTGWAYGMSVSDFEGKNIKKLENMQQGTYGTQPSLSSDGKYLVFAGYDGRFGDGNALKDGYRQAILTPNTVELLDTNTLSRTKLENLSNMNTYGSAHWDDITGNIVVTMVSQEKGQTGLYAYNLNEKSMKRINLPKSKTTNATFLSLLPSGNILAANEDESEASLGNLGAGYAPSLEQVYVLSSASPIPTSLTIQEPMVQYISTLPANYFQDVLGLLDQLNPQPTLIDLYSDKNATKERLQLYTFFLKSDLATTRLTQQTNIIPSTTTGTPHQLTLPPGSHQLTITIPPGSTHQFPPSSTNKLPPTTNDKGQPRCRELAGQQCKAKGLTDTSTNEYDECEDHLKDVNKDAGKCHDSPLYLYGPAGQQVSVWIQTPISNAIPSSAGNYDVTLGDNGNFSINGKTYPSISYDYVSNLRKIVRPTKGTIAKRADVKKVLRQYAQKLGLNDRETTNLVRDGVAKVTAPYVFISFFNQETSEQILPISFTPKPDNYLNIVFYIKNLASLPDYTPAAPDFPAPIKRTGFTAVEISEMAE